MLNQQITSAKMEELFSQYKWNNRVVLLLVDSDSSELLKQQTEMLNQDPEGFNDRDLVVLTIAKNKFLGGIEGFKFHKRFNPQNANFLFVLIGKDGGIKLSSDSLVSLEKLFQTIDAMPMRQNEMQDK